MSKVRIQSTPECIYHFRQPDPRALSWSGSSPRRRGHMDVPHFPAPPTLDGAATTLRNVPDIGPRTTLTLTSTPTRNLSRVRHVSSPGKIARHNSFSGSNNNNNNNSKNHGRRRSHRLGRFVNVVHPKINARETRKTRARVTELRVKMTERREDEEDDADVVCAPATPISYDSRTISEDLSVHVKEQIIQEESPPTRSLAVQTSCGNGPYRLRVLPALRDIVSEDANGNPDPKKTSRVCLHLRFLGRLSLCQFGLAWLLTFWAMAGAASFYATEGPREREQVLELKEMQRDLAVGLATELRQLRAQEQEMEPLWSNKVRQYVAKHEKLLLAAVSSGYGEGGDGGQLWTFPGCILFSVSLLTTLGFGAPVPRTTPGRTVAVVFAAIGIPAHFLLILNLGLLLAMRLQRYAIRRKYSPENEMETSQMSPVPKWVKYVPFCCIGGYYLLGIVCFGAARSRPIAASLLFPLDFTAAGGLATTSGHVRVMYAMYLEGAVTIAAVAVAVLRVSATQSFTNIGLKYGLLTEA